MTSDLSRAAGERNEFRKEALVMALYVAVCLLAALTALGERADHGHVRAFGLVWGTTIGLAAAHHFAFRVSARLVAEGELGAADRAAALAQIVGASGVAVLATIPILLFPATAEFDVVRWMLALFIAYFGFEVARVNGAGRRRSAIYGAVLLATALVIAIAKNTLSGH